MADTDPDLTITLHVTLPALPPRVFQALTDPEDMIVWMWGGIGHDPEAHVDLKPGGLYRVSVDVGEQPIWPRARWAMQGLYVEVAAPERLVYTVHWDAPVGYNQEGRAIDEVVFIDLFARGRETDMQYVHMGVPTPEAAAGHKKAIARTFELLRQHLAKMA